MKKLLSRSVAVLLTCALLVSGASAATCSIPPTCVNNQQRINDLRYVSLGDSIAGGIGLPDNPLRGPDQEDKEKVFCYKTPGAYPVLVAEALGIKDENFAQLACAGMRTVELRACLDPKYKVPDKFANNFSGNELEEWVKNRFDYRKYVKNADLITFNMCANDIASYALFYLRDEMSKAGVTDSKTEKLIEKLADCGDYTSALLKLIELGDTAKNYLGVAQAAIRGLYIGYTRWVENWDAIVGTIYKLNPDVTLVCVGMYNPFNHLKISSQSVLEVGAALDGLVAMINYWSAIGCPYSDKYVYVDVMGIESLCESKGNTLTDADFLGSFELNVHPSLNGQRQIADRILKQLPLYCCPLYMSFLSCCKLQLRSPLNAISTKLNKLLTRFV